jgi:hypothetical protein
MSGHLVWSAGQRDRAGEHAIRPGAGPGPRRWRLRSLSVKTARRRRPSLVDGSDFTKLEQRESALNSKPGPRTVPGRAIAPGSPWADMIETGDSYETNEWLDNILVSYHGYISHAALLYANGHDPTGASTSLCTRPAITRNAASPIKSCSTTLFRSGRLTSAP